MRFVESIFIGPQNIPIIWQLIFFLSLLSRNISDTFEALVMKLLCWFDAILFIRLYFDAEYIRRSFYCYCNTKMVWMIYSDLCSANSKSCKLLKHVSNGNIPNSLKQKLASPFIESYLNPNVKRRMKIIIKPNER